METLNSCLRKVGFLQVMSTSAVTQYYLISLCGDASRHHGLMPRAPKSPLETADNAPRFCPLSPLQFEEQELDIAGILIFSSCEPHLSALLFSFFLCFFLFFMQSNRVCVARGLPEDTGTQGQCLNQLPWSVLLQHRSWTRLSASSQT